MTSHDADRLAARLDLRVFTVLFVGAQVSDKLLLMCLASPLVLANGWRVWWVDSHPPEPPERHSVRVDVTL